MLIQSLNADVPPMLRKWLLEAIERGASDLHLVGGYPPFLRLHGELEPLPSAMLSEDEVRSVLTPLLAPATLEKFLAEKNLDFALEMPAAEAPQRFRVNFLMSGHNMAACFRVIPNRIPNFKWAGFPEDLAHRLAHFRDGLVLVCGVTGSGKTTTLAMLINLLIHEGGFRIITVEEPIEYMFPKTDNSVVTQREVGQDVLTFSDGLKYGLRQDPDVILVGEIRDRDTGQMALSAAETGHLVLASMHSRDAKGAILRFADLFPQTVQPEIRSQLATSLARRDQSAFIAQRRSRSQTRTGAGGDAEQFGQRQRDPVWKIGKHRQQHSHWASRRDDATHRIGQAIVQGRSNYSRDSGVLFAR